ncbi:MAG TPA: glycosyl hydrolase family 18 protein [Candidatus Limnocylindrales bacterium]|nr:glycosyl hydrolase family 18 protein [Candidatus Limnocylindrales bacterium]
MAFRFRRPLQRHGGRPVTALLALVLTGPGASGQLAPAAVHPAAPDRWPTTSPAEPTSRSIRTSSPAVDLARYDRGSSGTPPAGEVVAPTPPDAAGLAPSIQYEEAVRHANDRIDFAPGGRVTVGFTPRPDDHWPVDGRAPVALPGGRLDGGAIRAQGHRWDAGFDPSADQPADGGAATPATNASAIVPSETDPVSVEPEARVSLTGLRKEIFGFLPYWELNSSTLRLDYAKISTIAYFGVGADAAGNLQKRDSDGSLSVGWSGWTSSRMTSIISAAHKTHTRVVLTVQSFGWSSAGLTRQKSLLGSSTRRVNLARQIAAAVRDRGVDGVNLDFEPLASGYEAEFVALVKSIRYELNKIHSGYQITFDTLGSIGNYPLESATASGAADAIFIMGYDYRTAGSSPVGSIAPLDRAGYGILDTVLAYTARVSPSKLILGVPYYGRAWSTATDDVHSTNTSGTKYGASTTVVYDTAADYLAQHGRRWESTEAVAWTAYRRENCTSTYGCVMSWRQLYVDDAAAIGAKYDLVNRYRLRGAGIWALGYDGTRTDLWAVIQRKFVTDTTPPVVGIVSLPARQANPTFTVRWAGRDDVAVSSYDVQVSTNGGAWTNWRLATTATSAAWAGFDDTTYAFRVRARDPRANLSAWNVTSTSVAMPTTLAPGGFATVLVDGLSFRAAAGVDAPILGTFRSGAVLAVVAGPVAADGYTWLKVTGPLTEWRPVAAASTAWVASSGGRLGPAKAPNATRVAAALGDLGFNGAGAASVGTSASAIAHRAFSPNGDGWSDTIEIDWRADRDFDAVRLGVFRSDGSLVGSVPVPQISAGAHAFAWDGRVNGTLLADGRYLVSLAGSAGGSSFSNPGMTFRTSALARYGITIDRVPPVVTGSSISGTLISPNGDGILDGIAVALTASGSTKWTFAAAPVSGSSVGAAVTTRSGTGGTARVTWTGRTNGGAAVADGTYRLRLTAIDNAGNHVSRSWTVRVDATPATLTAKAAPPSFSPDGDGTADSTRISWTATERISGMIRIRQGSTIVRSWTLAAGTSGALTWTGLNGSGTRVADGTYTLDVIGRDAAGNRAARSIAVVVDRTLSTLRWNRAAFYPQDGDAITPSARLSFVIRRSAHVSVGIYHGPTLVRTIWTNRATSAGTYGWTWNGRNDAGSLVGRGTYEVRVTATSWVGTSVQARRILVDAFRVALSATSLRAGQTLTLTLTSTEALRSNPTVALTQPGLATVKRTATKLANGTYRVTFTIAAGSAGTAALRIEGRDLSGGLNVSLASVTIQ